MNFQELIEKELYGRKQTRINSIHTYMNSPFNKRPSNYVSPFSLEVMLKFPIVGKITKEKEENLHNSLDGVQNQQSLYSYLNQATYSLVLDLYDISLVYANNRLLQ